MSLKIEDKLVRGPKSEDKHDDWFLIGMFCGLAMGIGIGIVVGIFILTKVAG